MDNTNLVVHLQEEIQEIIETVENQLLMLDKEALNWKAAPDSWSALECFEHLNRYNRFYNAELEKALERSGKPAAFHPGWLGNYFVRSVAPDNTKAMKTMAHLNPSGSQLNKAVLEEFLNHQRHLLSLLTKAKGVNLNQRTIRVEVFRLLRMKIGDTFRFLVAHQQRHLQQALRTAQVMVG